MKITEIEVVQQENLWTVFCDSEESLNALSYDYTNEAEAWAKVEELKKDNPDAFIVPKQGMP